MTAGLARKCAGAVLLLGVLVSCATADKSLSESPPAPGLFSVVLDVYQGPLDHLAAVRSGSCPMHPSCSEYSRECLRRYGPLKGWMMVFDRLLRCGRDEIYLSPAIMVDSQRKIFDPVENNAL